CQKIVFIILLFSFLFSWYFLKSKKALPVCLLKYLQDF
ncbi:MAG: hypothetical protein AVDCRST_MAG96-4212, partial [uncultured Segetibacter sp.]